MVAHRKRVKTREWVTRSGKRRQIRLYKAWANMKQRCTNPNRHDYKHYGGRGIAICREWLTFQPFKDWAVAAGYAKGLTVERIDNERGYSPDNCELVTIADQQRNQRKTVKITHNGETLCINQWARRLGIHHETLRQRIKTHGPERAVSLGGPQSLSSTERDKLQEVGDD